MREKNEKKTKQKNTYDNSLSPLRFVYNGNNCSKTNLHLQHIHIHIHGSEKYHHTVTRCSHRDIELWKLSHVS